MPDTGGDAPGGDSHPVLALTDLVHQRARLGILTVLVEAKRADFNYLKRALDLTDGNLGRHLAVLSDNGLVDITKDFIGNRPRTWATITTLGREALAAQMAALKELIERVDRASSE